LELKITDQDLNEVKELAGLLVKIDNIDEKYAHEISDEIFKQQPFFLSVLMGYYLDTTPEELEEIMKIYFLIWEYFKQQKSLPTKKVTEAYYEKIQNRNIQMLKYAEGEPKQSEVMKIYSNDLLNLKSKALLTAVLFRFNNRPVLLKMDEKKKGIITFGIKSFIECFETI
jgi:hypothetical protein